MADVFAATITAATHCAEASPASAHSLVIEVDAELFASLEAHALSCGVNPPALVAQWIEPHLRDLCRSRRPS